MKNFYAVLFFLLSLPIAAQIPFTCFAEEAETQLQTFSNEDFVYDEDARHVVKVFFHIIEDVGVAPEDEHDEEDVMWAMSMLAKNYTKHKIYFKYTGFQKVNDPVKTMGVGYHSLGLPNVYNVYLLNYVSGYSGLAYMGNTWVALTFDAFDGAYGEHLVTHEMGHCMDLYHTFNNWDFAGQCEHVTRDPNDPDYNADAAGDWVEDTPAQYQVNAFEYVNCIYVNSNNSVDCVNNLYTNILPGNFMSYDAGSNCGYHFTPGQVVRMRSHLQDPLMAHVPLTYTTFDSLFEPYHTEIVANRKVYDATDNNDGTLTVCYEPVWLYYFQMGYPYSFKNPDNASVSRTYDPVEWPIFLVKPGTLKVTSKPLGSRILTVPSLSGVPPFCEIQEVVSGSVYSTLDLGSDYGTDTPMTPAQLQDPNFASTLPPGYYHVIKKRTASGAHHSVTVYIP